MRSKTSERARRIILSSLLRSDLTMTEIREIGKAFMNESDFSEHLGCLIKDVSMSIDASIRMGHTKHLMVDYERHDDPFDKAMLLINKRRFPKKKIVPILRALRPDMKRYFQEPKRTMREMVGAFFSTASSHEIAELMDWLEQGLTSSDAYLKGIMRRS